MHHSMVKSFQFFLSSSHLTCEWSLDGDQGLLNSYFSDWSQGDISRHLPFTHNVTSNTFYSYLPAIHQCVISSKRLFNSSESVYISWSNSCCSFCWISETLAFDIQSLHWSSERKSFIVERYSTRFSSHLVENLFQRHFTEILFQQSSQRSLQSHSCPLSLKSFDFRNGIPPMNSHPRPHHHYQVEKFVIDLIELSRENRFTSESSKGGNLSYSMLWNKTNEGILSGSAEHHRAWESGQIDYQGKDSFQNILQHLDQSLSHLQSSTLPNIPRVSSPSPPLQPSSSSSSSPSSTTTTMKSREIPVEIFVSAKSSPPIHSIPIAKQQQQQQSRNHCEKIHCWMINVNVLLVYCRVSSLSSDLLKENFIPSTKSSEWKVTSTIYTAHTQGLGEQAGPTMISKVISETIASSSASDDIQTISTGWTRFLHSVENVFFRIDSIIKDHSGRSFPKDFIALFDWFSGNDSFANDWHLILSSWKILWFFSMAIWQSFSCHYLYNELMLLLLSFSLSKIFKETFHSR